MDLIIPANTNTCIQNDLPIKLGDYTILAGENNSGKSSIARALMEHPDLASYEKLFIPAEKVSPKESALKATAAADPFYKIIQIILKPIFDKAIIDGLVTDFDNSTEKAAFITGVNSILKEYGVEKKEFDVKIPVDNFEAKIVIKIAEGILRDLYATKIDEVDINNIGMGTQRLLIAALLQYYDRNKLSDDVKSLIIFEEPEIYLHPKLKKSLHKILLELSKKTDTMVVVTTHDPYFIELGKDQVIYKVFRDEKKMDSTNLMPISPSAGILPYSSDSEINYQVFDLESKTYFLELWQYIKNKRSLGTADLFEDDLSTVLGVPKDRNHDFDVNKKLTYISRLRHDLAHPQTGNPDSFLTEGKLATEALVEYSKKVGISV